MTAKLLYSHQTVASKLASAVDCHHRHPPLMSCSWLPVWNDTVVHSDFKQQIMQGIWGFLALRSLGF
jgi:hypothetical protein